MVLRWILTASFVCWTLGFDINSLPETLGNIHNEIKQLKTENQEIKNDYMEIKKENADLKSELLAIAKNNQLALSRVVVAFSVAREGGNYNPPVGQNIQYNYVVSNLGGGYQPDQHAFFAPIQGVYAISACIQRHSSTACLVGIYENENLVAEVRSLGSDGTGCNVLVLSLKAGSAVSVRALQSCTMNASYRYNTFTGFLIN